MADDLVEDGELSKTEVYAFLDAVSWNISAYLIRVNRFRLVLLSAYTLTFALAVLLGGKLFGLF